MTVLAYTGDPVEAAARLRPAVAACGPDRVAAGLTLLDPETPDAATLRRVQTAAATLGVRAVSVYNHSLVPRGRLAWPT